MATNKRVFTLRLEDDVFDKIGVLATSEHRSVTTGIFVLSGKGLTDHLHMGEFLQNLASLYRNILADTASCQLVVPQLQLGGTVHDLVRCVHSKPGGHGEVVCPCRDDLTALHLLFAHVAAQVVVDLYHAHAVSNKLEVTTLELVFTEPGDHLIGDLLMILCRQQGQRPSLLCLGARMGTSFSQ